MYMKESPENVAVGDDLSHFELGMLYECGDDSIPIADIDSVLAEWFELAGEPYFNELCAGVPPELKTDNAGYERHFYRDDGTLEQNVYEARWDRFVEGVQCYKHRYFNAEATEFLDSIFSALVAGGDQLKAEVVRTIRPGDLLFRARQAQSQKQAERNLQRSSPSVRTHAKTSGQQPANDSEWHLCSLLCAGAGDLPERDSLHHRRPGSQCRADTHQRELKLLDLTVLRRVEPPALTLLDEGF